jgi:hypothetical protein
MQNRQEYAKQCAEYDTKYAEYAVIICRQYAGDTLKYAEYAIKYVH